MANSTLKQTRSANGDASGATQPAGGNSTKLLIFGALILGIAGATIVLESALVPQRSGSHAGRKREDSEQTSSHTEPMDKSAGDEFAEVALGDFSFSNRTALRGVITHVDFRLAALASLRHVSTLESQIKSNQGRIREAINKIVRNCNLDELNDPNLGAIKRLVREELNELLGKKLIVELLINDIRIIQQ